MPYYFDARNGQVAVGSHVLDDACYDRFGRRLDVVVEHIDTQEKSGNDAPNKEMSQRRQTGRYCLRESVLKQIWRV